MPSRGIKLNRTPEFGSVALATPTVNSLPLRRADFASLADALDYAAQGDTGANFYAGSGKLATVLPYRMLRAAGAGARPAPPVAPAASGARGSPSWRRPIRTSCASSSPASTPGWCRWRCRPRSISAATTPTSAGCAACCRAAGLPWRWRRASSCASCARRPKAWTWPSSGTPAAFDELPEQDVELRPSGPTETAYLQYTSGSTSFPRGVVITQHAVLSNLAGVVNHGLDIQPDDRCVSWLPFYHDMGLVGCMLAPMATQRSIDYLDTRDFAMRPRRWLELMTSTRATISFSPPFGYELCARRIRAEDVARLRPFRVAHRGHRRRAHPRGAARSLRQAAGAGGIRSPRVRALLRDGGELARDQLLAAAAGRRRRLDRRRSSRGAPARDSGGRGHGPRQRFRPVRRAAARARGGHPRRPGQRRCPIFTSAASRCAGRASCRAISAQPEQTRQALSPDGWLDTGDIGYLVDGSIVVTGRHKDMIIINGRNIWPQDIEHIAERQPELRSMDASAFFVLGPDDEEVAVVVVQCNISDPAESRLADPAAASGDPRRARHHLPDRARAAAHAAAHVFGQAVARGGARRLPAAARAGAQGRARRRRQAVVRRAGEPAGGGVGPIAGRRTAARGLVGRDDPARPIPRRSPLDRSVPRCADRSDRIHRRGVAFAPDRRRMARARALSAAGRAHAAAICPASNGCRAISTIRTRCGALVAGTDAVIHCAGTVRGARRADFDRVNAEGAGRVARAAASLPRGAAVPADVLAGGAHAGAVPLRRQQVARRMRGQGGVGEPALDGAATAGGVRARAIASCARCFAASPAASRRCPPARRALFAPPCRRSRDGGAALARRRHRLRPDLRAR